MVMGTYLAAVKGDRTQENLAKTLASTNTKLPGKRLPKKRVARKVQQKKQYGNFKIVMKSVHKYIKNIRIKSENHANE